METQTFFIIVILLTAVERLFELRLSKINARWSFSQGGKEYGHSHYPFMVILHSSFLVACIAEVWWFNRIIEWPMQLFFLAFAIASQGLRWWCITSLGKQWNTRVIVIPGAGPVTKGPYRWLQHPNYVAVIAEGICLPMMHNAWLTAIGFTVLNAWLLKTRIQVENSALKSLHQEAPVYKRSNDLATE